MAVRFNPPPGWDVPERFSPEPGWAPDPAWPAPPADWQWWVQDAAPAPQPVPAPAFVIPPRPDDVPAPDAAPEQPLGRTRERGRKNTALLVTLAVVGVVVVVGGGVAVWTLRGSDPTHEINGTLVVNDFGAVDTYEGCMAGDAQTQLDMLEDLMAGETFPCPDGLGGGYSDITDGTSVTVKDGSGELLGTGFLTGGQMTALGATFEFTIPDVPEADFYQVEVSHRGALSYSREELEEAGWVIETSLG